MGREVVVPMRRAVPDQRPSGRDAVVVELFDRHYASLCRLGTVILGDAAAAEEVVQDAFARTLSGWWRLRRQERAPAYLRAAVVNGCRSRLRRRSTEDRGNRVVWAGDVQRLGHPPAAPVEDVVVVLDAVRALPRRQREAVILRYYADLSETDVADALGCSVGTVKSQLAKARATLARELAGLLPGSPARVGIRPGARSSAGRAGTSPAVATDPLRGPLAAGDAALGQRPDPLGGVPPAAGAEEGGRGA